MSVIICTFNGEKYLQQTIDSVLSQTYKNLEIIIVDDGSEDNTKNIIVASREKDQRIKSYFQKNKGLANARNKAFKKCSGEWIAIIDQDDLCYPTRIEEQLNHSYSDPSVDLIFCNTDYIDEHDNIIGQHLSNFELPGQFLKRVEVSNLLLRQGCFIDSESFFMRKKAIERNGPLEESLRYVCDYEYFIRVGLVCNVSYVDKTLAAWRIHSNQATQTSKLKYSEMIFIYKKYLMHPDIWLVTKWRIFMNLLKIYLKMCKSLW